MMWGKLVGWHREWESEIFAVLENPALAPAAPAGYRGCIASKLAALSGIERQQLLLFSRTYQGWRLYAAIGKLILVCCVAGAALHLASPDNFGWTESLFVANGLGLSTALALAGIWFNYRRLHGRLFKSLVRVLLLTMAGAFTGAVLTALVDGRPVLMVLEKSGRAITIGGLVMGCVFALLIGVVASWRNHEFERLTTQFQLEAESERLARKVSDSQLRLLQAQIEPHFLFNTLGAVQQLAEAGAPRAAELTANLITFLRGSLTEMREEQVTLAEDFALIGAYLKVMQTRLGDRLQFRLDLPDSLTNVRVPSMMLLTLVENAIKHGIEPALRGGEVTVSAQRIEDAIRIRVHDTGQGLGAGMQAGVGLKNVRDRLLLTYGNTATLALFDAEAGGAIADLRFPS